MAVFSAIQVNTMKYAVSAREIRFFYGKKQVLELPELSIASGTMTSLTGPDGAGKSTLLALIAGIRRMHFGELYVLGENIREKRSRERLIPRIAYMPQGLGKNLYFSLTVEENLRFFSSLFGYGRLESRQRIERLTRATGLYPFLGRSAGTLSGGMKQKLGLCCALIHDPELLILDEPATGVDPLARQQFRELLAAVREETPEMSIIVSTASLDEAARFTQTVLMDNGKILFSGTPGLLLEKTGAGDYETAFNAILPACQRRRPLSSVREAAPPHRSSRVVINARHLTRKFGSFTAVDDVSFRIFEGEIFGFIGSNGCGKTTTMRMLAGLIPASSGTAELFGRSISGNDADLRKKIGFMTQNFSLYNELTLRQNLFLYARLYGLSEKDIPLKTAGVLQKFRLEELAEALPGTLPPGIRQRLSLAAAVIHDPAMLILDEPTSGVDPVSREELWDHITGLSRENKVTVFISTHFMNEANRCDRISLMHNGKSIVCGVPQEIVDECKCRDLEEAFIFLLQKNQPEDSSKAITLRSGGGTFPVSGAKIFSFRRFYSCFRRELEELIRDPIRITLALFGSLLLMAVMGFGISLDVEDLKFAVLDRDCSPASVNFILDLAGSRYFIERPPLKNYEELEKRMRSGEISMALEIPPGFGRDLDRGKRPQIAVWLDGAMPARAETMGGYVRGMYEKWLSERQPAGEKMFDVEIRYRYNPDVRSLAAIVPGIIPVLLMMLPATLTALAVVREKESGSIINFYVTPLTKAEFLLGKQLPYMIFASLSALFMTAAAVSFFGVPVKGNVFLLLAGLFLYSAASTAFGLLCSMFTRSQIAVIFLAMLATMLPSMQLCGLITPVENQGTAARIIGTLYPTTHMLLISRGIFNKALGFSSLWSSFLYFGAAVPLMLAGAVCLLKKQER